MENKSSLASIFLREFTRRLILNSKPKYIENSKQTFYPGEYTHNTEDYQPSIHKPKRILTEHHQVQSARFQRPISKLMKQGKPMTYSNANLGKISTILKDPAVQSLECSGPGKPILVNRSGVIQKTSITFKQEEIKEIVDSFAKQARIPLAGKVFKAALGDLILTAILSDFVGTRFIIEKKLANYNFQFKKKTP